jgi:hypothetical protein
MAYTKTTWIDRLVQFPGRFTKSSETASSVTLTAYPGTRIWTVSDGFSFEEANRIENDVRLLFITAKNVFDSFVPCGTVQAGYIRGSLYV